MSPRRDRQLARVRRMRLRGQRRRALERARRAVLRRRQVRAEVLEVWRELAPLERVRRLLLTRTPRGFEVSFRAVVVWRGGRS